MRWIWLVLLVGCGSDFASGESMGLDAATHDEAEQVDVGPGSIEHEDTSEGSQRDDVAQHDASQCTPVTSFPAPSTCECFLSPGDCAPLRDGGASPDCLWAEAPTSMTGSPTCRGCARYTFPKNDCARCRETFTCACLAPFLSAGQKCCDGAEGPFLSSYACP